MVDDVPKVTELAGVTTADVSAAETSPSLAELAVAVNVPVLEELPLVMVMS